MNLQLDLVNAWVSIPLWTFQMHESIVTNKLQEYNKNMNTLHNGNMPIAKLFNNIEDCHRFPSAGVAEIMPKQVTKKS